MGKRIFIDDERFPQTALMGGLLVFDMDLYKNDSDWVIVRNYEEFVDEVTKSGLPEYVSFDHDLADISYSNGKMSWSYREMTGYDCAKWLVDHCYDNGFKLPKYQVHSANSVGKENIQNYLNNAKKHLNI